MRKKIQRYLSGEREGFSLIELIIVIAIMAILVGVVALVVIPYLEDARESSDRATLSEVFTAYRSAVANNASVAPSGNYASVTDDLEKAINEYLEGELSDAQDSLAASECKGGSFVFSYDSDSGALAVSIMKPGGSGESGVAVDGGGEPFTDGTVVNSAVKLD